MNEYSLIIHSEKIKKICEKEWVRKMKRKIIQKITIPETENIEFIIKIELNAVNCYLIKVKSGFILIDTGYTKHRNEIDVILESEGCQPGNLNAIILTHGDFDHIGNCAYFQRKFNCKVAMHRDDLGMAQFGDLFWNRDLKCYIRFFGKIILFLKRIRLKKDDRFKPDLYLEDGQDLSDLGFNAKVIHLPGHSKGSIGVLTSNGDLFCGDLLMNTRSPEKNNMISDTKDYKMSIERINHLNIRTVYPGHGNPFLMSEYINIIKEVE